ncbi:Folic acid synthesis protein fol1 like [Verticillium longisporum]|nr:Folic acid synthesis protein fol1 like [Verticillium longisporum]
MLPLVARAGATVCLMHMRGTPQTMSSLNDYPDGLVPTVARELLERVAEAEAAGIRRWRIVLDPGLGFAKVGEQNLELLSRLPELRAWPGLEGFPWLVGSSRKTFIGRVTGVPKAEERIWGTAATVAAAVSGGADVVRVHDAVEMCQVFQEQKRKRKKKITRATASQQDLGGFSPPHAVLLHYRVASAAP